VSLRVAVVSMVVGGLVTAGLPFLVWYAIDTPAGHLTATGVQATPELWSLVALGALIALVGVAVGAGRGSGTLVLIVVGASGVAVGWALENALNVPVGLLVTEPGGTPGRVANDLVRVDVQPAAYLAAAAAAIAGMAALLRRLEEIS
jgi:hypothetical protein